MQAVRMAGVQAIVAESFGRIFYRNAMSLGVPAFVCAEAGGFAADGDGIAVDGRSVRNHASGREARIEAIDPFWAAVLEAGGMMAFLASRGEVG